MDLLHPRCAGLDVSKRDAKVCVRVANDFGRRPSPLGIRRVDKRASNNNLVATTARSPSCPWTAAAALGHGCGHAG